MNRSNIKYSSILLLFFSFLGCSYKWTLPNDDFMIIAHRGASGSAPENTIPAIIKAINDGANYIEIDVHQTLDGKIVVIHDYSVDRTTNYKGEVKDLTYSEIEKMEAGKWFSDKFEGTKVPLLDEVLNYIPDSVKLIIEVKGDSSYYPGIENNIVNVLRKSNLEDRIILKSFDEDVLRKFKLLAPEIPRLLVYVFGFCVLDTDCQYLQHYEMFLREDFVKSAKDEGYKIIAWGVQSKSTMEKVLSYGVDGIETDYPELLVKLLREKAIRKTNGLLE